MGEHSFRGYTVTKFYTDVAFLTITKNRLDKVAKSKHTATTTNNNNQLDQHKKEEPKERLRQ